MVIVVKKCVDCPLCSMSQEHRWCSVSVINRRPIMQDVTDRPDWCPLRKEQVIVREPS